MKKPELTLLEEEQIFGENRLSIFDKVGVKAAITDYAIALGGFVSDSNYTECGKSTLEDRTGYYWTKTCDGDNDARVVGSLGRRILHNVNSRDGGIRAALPYSLIRQIASNETIGKDGVLELECGMLPRKAASKQMQKELEASYNRGGSRIFNRELTFNRTSKKYTIDAKNYDQYSEKVEPEEREEIDLSDGRRYTKIPIKPRFDGNSVKLSNGEIYRVGDLVWVETFPVIWYGDPERDIAITKEIITAGIPFNHISNYKGDFSETDMYSFMNMHLIKDMGILDLWKRQNNSNENLIREEESLGIEENERLKEVLDFMISSPTLATEEIMVLKLKLGYIHQKNFSNKEISNFLGREEKEVKELASIALQKLSIYQENIDYLGRDNGKKGPVKTKKR